MRTTFAQASAVAVEAKRPTAVVYCEANFGSVDGKTANGLVRHSEKYEILSVIDSEKEGLDAGMVLGEEPNAIPVCHDLADAMTRIGGAQPGAGGHFPRNERRQRSP